MAFPIRVDFRAQAPPPREVSVTFEAGVGKLGIIFEQSEGEEQPQWAKVQDVTPASPAALKGVVAGCVVLALNGKALYLIEPGEVQSLLQSRPLQMKVQMPCSFPKRALHACWN